VKGVILAAGYGRRFALGEGRLHKLLLRIGNRAVIDYTLEAFGKAGITDVAMVVGYRAELLREYNGDGARHGIHLEYLFNPQYERGNALSLNTAKSFTQEEPFLLCMGDHLVSPELLSRMLAPATDSSALAVDFSPDIHDIEEATRVRVDSEGCINRIGKDLHEWDGVDAGVFRLTPAIYEAITAVTCEERDEHQISEAVTWMISQGYRLNACDISGCFWQDVDTWEDLRHARAALAETTL
jgi:choline kinase